MRFLLATLLTSALAVPVLAQPPRGGGEGGGGNREQERGRPLDRPVPSPEVEKLTNRIKELEKQLAETKGKKDEGKKEEKKREDRKPAELNPQPIPPREGRFETQPDRSGWGRPEVGNPFNPVGQPREGQPRPTGGLGGGGGFGVMTSGGPRGGGIMSFSAFPGLDNLSKEEQEMFQKLISKMRTPKPASAATRGNVEERLERLENMMQKLMQKLDR